MVLTARRLSLKREALADLSPEELSGIAGGDDACDAITCRLVQCVIDQLPTAVTVLTCDPRWCPHTFPNC